MAQPRQHSTDADGRQRGHLREVGAEDGPRQSDVAAELYQTRLRLGIELDYAAGELRIHYEQLLALEEGRFDDLPGPAYVIGFLRSYAAYLDLDGDEMVRRFKAETTDFDARQELTFPSPHDDGRVPTGALIALGLALVGAAYAGWYYVANVDRVAIERIPEVPERLAMEVPPRSEPLSIDAPLLIDDIGAAIPEPVVAAADAPPGEGEARAMIVPADSLVDTLGDTAAMAEAPEAPEPVAIEPEPEAASASEAVAAVTVEPLAAEPVEAQVEAIEPEPGEPAPAESEAAEPEMTEPEMAEPESVEPEPIVSEPVVAEPQQPEPQQTASVVPEIPAPVVESTDYAPREFGLANSGSTIRLRALLESWVQITGADNELLLTRILRPGDIYHVPDRPGLVLMTGNAGGLEVLVGDVVAPALGPIGKVQRRVALDPERLLAGTAVD